jgi:hypothetical protein
VLIEQPRLLGTYRNPWIEPAESNTAWKRRDLDTSLRSYSTSIPKKKRAQKPPGPLTEGPAAQRSESA